MAATKAAAEETTTELRRASGEPRPSPGEFELIAKLRERLGAGAGESRATGAEVIAGSGDDAAITVPEGATATSVDLAVEGVHFRRSTFPERAIGHKALAAALSDLAAMGATSGEAYVQLGIPRDLGEEAILEIAGGMGDLAAEHGVEVLGGDLSRAPTLLLAVTVVGHAEAADAFVRRSGARPGDVVCVTGQLGGAAGGLLLLERPELRGPLSAELADALLARQLSPQPRIDAGRALAGAGVTAMIDISDGLGADAAHLAAASAVAIEVEVELIPVQAGVAELAHAAGLDPAELAASGGEDYELLVALPEETFESAERALARGGVALTRMGRVAAGEGVELRRDSGAALELEGFDQLRADPP